MTLSRRFLPALRGDLAELWDDLYPRRRRPWAPKTHRWWAVRHFLCRRGHHWPIKWSESAYPGSWDPPGSPEPGYCCNWCGHVRDPYSWWWRSRTIWRVKQWWYERPGGAFDREMEELQNGA